MCKKLGIVRTCGWPLSNAIKSIQHYHPFSTYAFDSCDSFRSPSVEGSCGSTGRSCLSERLALANSPTQKSNKREVYRYVLKISSMEGRTLFLVYDLMNFMHLPCQNGDTLRVCLTVRVCTWMDSKPSHVMADGWERRGAVEQGTPCVVFRLDNIGPDLPIELILSIYKNHPYNEDL